MLPVAKQLEAWKFPRVAAAFISLIAIVAVFALVIVMFSSQVASFTNDLPGLEEKLKDRLDGVQQWIQSFTGWDSRQQIVKLNTSVDQFMGEAGSLTTNILKSTGSTLLQFILMLVYFIFFLLYRDRIKKFFLLIIKSQYHETTLLIIEGISQVTQRYLRGILIVMSIIAVLNSVGLMIVGLRHAIFLGVFAAVLNIIPYIGIWTACAICMLTALLTSDQSWGLLGIFIVFFTTHFFDANFLTPRIVGSQIKVNPMATLAAVIIGEMVWGIAGTVLFIPLLGISKIVFTHLEPLKPFAYLMSDDEMEDDTVIMKALRKAKVIKKTPSEKK
jgi:predicted PurR-regulated permease PerM